ncbi:hypothetical protein N7516_006956 [Penicillium verrucosum]|uniref:uncharacterized protein n=1 Tax=Penicillium verrucosum TaxID=60171 RepID=UPI00254598A7|nr:uncharacterized protein N7516_006956 [Penicillium verrucosum]KAJ5932467.1 hypothetical protein N7516_006956 [Penicillium verrucosum]
MRLNIPHVFRGTRQVNYGAQMLSDLLENTHEKDSFDLGADLHGPQRCTRVATVPSPYAVSWGLR